MAMNPRLLVPRASGFNPRRIANLLQWYDASDRATLFDATTGGSAVADDGTVARWEDKSGNGYHLTQGTAGNRPALRGAIRNGRSVLEYDGANSNLVSGSITNGLTTLSVFAVFFAETLGQNILGFIWANNTGLGTGATRQFRIQAGPTMSVTYGTNDSRIVAASLSLSAWTRYHSFWTGGTNRATDFSFLVNGTSFAPETAGAITTEPTVTPTTAVGNSPIGNRAWDGYIAEVLVYTRNLSTSERTAVDNWLARKWGF